MTYSGHPPSPALLTWPLNAVEFACRIIINSWGLKKMQSNQTTITMSKNYCNYCMLCPWLLLMEIIEAAI